MITLRFHTIAEQLPAHGTEVFCFRRRIDFMGFADLTLRHGVVEYTWMLYDEHGYPSGDQFTYTEGDTAESVAVACGVSPLQLTKVVQIDGTAVDSDYLWVSVDHVAGVLYPDDDLTTEFPST